MRLVVPCRWSGVQVGMVEGGREMVAPHAGASVVVATQPANEGSTGHATAGETSPLTGPPPPTRPAVGTQMNGDQQPPCWRCAGICGSGCRTATRKYSSRNAYRSGPRHAAPVNERFAPLLIDAARPCRALLRCSFRARVRTRSDVDVVRSRWRVRRTRAEQRSRSARVSTPSSLWPRPRFWVNA